MDLCMVNITIGTRLVQPAPGLLPRAEDPSLTAQQNEIVRTPGSSLPSNARNCPWFAAGVLEGMFRVRLEIIPTGHRP
jgi:hypothetical protein